MTDRRPYPTLAPAGPALPLLDTPPRERADAARNRARVLDAASRLVAEGGVEALAMDDVARLAEVGVGTIYRRFGDRAGLVDALVHDDELRFQEKFLHGDPPLGPGAPAGTRIRAFLRALARRVHEHGDLLLAAESSGPLNRFGRAYAVHRTHLTALVAEAAPPGTDAPWVADALLATTSAALVTHQLGDRGMTIARIEAGLAAAVERLVGAPPPE